MARKLARSAGASQAILAWAVLAFIIVWLFVNWPKGPEGPATAVSSQSSAREQTETTSGASASQPEERAEVATESLNFRSDPVSEDRNIIKTLGRGTKMKVLKKEEGWLFVELDTGQSGYVADGPGFVRAIE